MFKANKRNTQNWHPSNVYILNSEHNSHYFLVFLWHTLNRKIVIWIASSDYNKISLYIYLFQAIKRCYQVPAETTSLLKKLRITMFKKEVIFVTFMVQLYEKQLGSIRGNSHSTGCCWYVQSLLFLFCLYIIEGDDALTAISPFESKWDEQKLI